MGGAADESNGSPAAANGKAEAKATTKEKEPPKEEEEGDALSLKPAATPTGSISLEEKLGKVMLTHNCPEWYEHASTAKVLADKELILLYFSAIWCPPCKVFSPMLKVFDKKHAAQQSMEVIYVSSDRSVQEFQEYYETMPWLAMQPAGQEAHELKNKLKSELSVKGIPTLVVLDGKTGQYITKDARRQVRALYEGSSASGGGGGQVDDEAAELALIESWKKAERLSWEEGVARDNAAAGEGGPLSLGGVVYQAFTTLMRNPVYLVGLYYLYQYVMGKLSSSRSIANPPLLQAEDEPAQQSTGNDEF